MRFLFFVAVLFGASFGGVYWYQLQQQPRGPVDIVALLEREPEEYRRVQRAFSAIGPAETGELERALIAYDSHRNKNTLRQDVGGLASRAVEDRRQMLDNAGLAWQERITRRTVDLMRRYASFGEVFCTYALQRDHVNAERVLGQNRRQQETAELIEEFTQTRFELAVLMLEAVVDGKSNPEPLPDYDPGDLNDILIASASAENARMIRKLKAEEWSCSETLTVLETALAIKDDGDRHVLLAEMRTGL